MCAHFCWLMIKNSQISGHNLVLKKSSCWDIDPVSMIGNNDNSALREEKIEAN